MAESLRGRSARESVIGWRIAERVVVTFLAIGTYYLWRWVGVTEPEAVVGSVVLWVGHWTAP